MSGVEDGGGAALVMVCVWEGGDGEGLLAL